MISQEKFDELESQYGCGYWNVCWEHACPCAITTEDKGLQESIYNSLVQEAREIAEMDAKDSYYDYEDDDDFDYDDMYDEDGFYNDDYDDDLT